MKSFLKGFIVGILTTAGVFWYLNSRKLTLTEGFYLAKDNLVKLAKNADSNDVMENLKLPEISRKASADYPERRNADYEEENTNTVPKVNNYAYGYGRPEDSSPSENSETWNNTIEKLRQLSGDGS